MAGIHVIVYEKGALLASRIKNLLALDNDLLYMVSEKGDLWDILFRTQGGSRIVMADIDGENDNGLFFLRRIVENAVDAKVIVLSSNSGRQFFVSTIKAGAADFICKPFEDKPFCNKMENYLNVRKSENAVELVTFNFSRYLRGELRKAQKGKYPVSLMFLTYYTEGQEDISESGVIDRYIFENIQNMFWDTDVFVRFGKKYFIGVFPFCSTGSTKVIAEKISKRFEEMRNSFVRLSQYRICDTFVTYPDDAPESGLLSRLLVERARAEINDDIRLTL